MFRFVTPNRARELRKYGARVVDVSSRAPIPYRYLSPFYPHGNIPIPGMKGKVADSVEGIWQGLKVIGGKLDLSYFIGRGKKRRVKGVQGHLYGDRSLDYRSARKLIYIPSYRRMVYNAPLAREIALELLNEGLGVEVHLHDVDTNADVEDLRKPLAHASILATILNENLEVIRQYWADKDFRKEYDGEDTGGKLTYPLADVLIQEQRKESVDMDP